MGRAWEAIVNIFIDDHVIIGADTNGQVRRDIYAYEIIFTIYTVLYYIYSLYHFSLLYVLG